MVIAISMITTHGIFAGTRLFLVVHPGSLDTEVTLKIKHKKYTIHQTPVLPEDETLFKAAMDIYDQLRLQMRRPGRVDVRGIRPPKCLQPASACNP